MPRKRSSPPDDDNAEAVPTAADAGDETDEENVLLGSPNGNSFDAAYQMLRSEQGNNILEHAEREFIRRALEEAGGKQVKAAEILGMTRATLRKRIDRYDLST